MGQQYITPLPQVAGRYDADFIETADLFLKQLPTTCEEMNEAIDDVNNWLGNKDEAYIKMYLGPNSEDPTTRNDGSDLQVGDLYFNTNSKEMRVYNSDGWVSLSALLNGGQVDGDISFVKEVEGVVLIDRSDTTKKYRLFINDGNLGIEEVWYG